MLRLFAWAFLSVGPASSKGVLKSWRAMLLAWEALGRRSGDVSTRLIDFELLYSSRLEVIDARRGVLLTRIDLPSHLSGFTNDGLLVGYEETDGRVGRVVLWKPALLRSL